MLSEGRRASVRIDVRPDRSNLIKMKLGKWNFLGGALRRVLMSSAAGWAIVGLSFGKDPRFQFLSKVKGIAEDVSTVLMNAKKLMFRGGGEETCFRAEVSAEGKFDLTGRDVKLPKGVELINPEERICRFTGGSAPQMELLVAKCRGYMTAAAVKATFGAAFNEFVWTNVNFNPIEKVTCFNKTNLQTSADGFDCKLIAVNGGVSNPIDMFAEACEELLAAVASAEVVKVTNEAGESDVKPTMTEVNAAEGVCSTKWAA
ncbi:MAG: hypothetical protein ACTS6G_02655 [Candidatus Hodgkinia cicadicola]